jgi:hypothetical protein
VVINHLNNLSSGGEGEFGSMVLSSAPANPFDEAPVLVLPYLNSQDWTAGTWDDRTAENQRRLNVSGRGDAATDEGTGMAVEQIVAADRPVAETRNADADSSWQPTILEDVLDDLLEDDASGSSQDEAILAMFGIQ